MPEHVAESPHLNCGERRQADRHAPLRNLVIHEIIRAEGEAELNREPGAMVWSGLAAGLSMGFSFLAQALLAANLHGQAGAEVVSSLGYALGFIIVVLGRQQLFTESTLTAALPVLTRPTARALGRTLRLWAIVLAANIAGTWILAAALVFGHPAPAEAAPALARLAGESLSHGFGDTLLRACFAGWLIALMVWLLPSAGSARILVILVLTWMVAAAKLSHIIAGSTEAAYGVLADGAPFSAYLWRFFVPTLLGNTIGGVLLVALLNHAPAASEMEAQDGPEDPEAEASG